MEHREHTSHTSSCETGDTCVLERPRYFPRQLITPTELTLEQDYFREKQRLHNRFLHGWGVVCGARVCPVPTVDGSGFEPWKVRVERGYLLDPLGNDILLDRARNFDLRTRCQTVVAGEPCTDPEDDPWCRDTFERPRTEDAPVYVAVRYVEFPRRPVRVQPAGCGCDDSQCEYSRWCDGYEICVLPKCPESHCRTEPRGSVPGYLDAASAAGPMSHRPSRSAAGGGALPAPGMGVPCCPECPTDPWVVLAKVVIDASGNVQTIDNCACRRLVVSFAKYWWTCETGLEIADAPPATLAPEQVTDLTFAGKGFASGFEAHLGEGITVSPVGVAPGGGSMTIHVVVAGDAPLGRRTLTVRNSDCATATLLDAAIVARAEGAGEEGEAAEKVSPKRPRRATRS